VRKLGAYRDLARRLTQELKQAPAKRDTTLLDVVRDATRSGCTSFAFPRNIPAPATRHTSNIAPI